MATKITEVASFDVQTDKAVKSINNYINRLKALEMQRKQNIKLGKDTAAVNKEIDKTIGQINASLKQQANTTKGVIAQQKAIRSLQKDISAENQKRLGLIDKETRARRSLGQSLRQNRRQFADLRFVAAGAATAIVAGLAGVAEGLDKLQEFLFPTIALTRRLGEATASAAQEYVVEKNKLDALFESASANNENKQEQVAAVDQILEQYGPYLTDLEKEQLRLGNVAAAQARATDQLLANIVAKEKARVAEQLLGEAIDGIILQQQRQAESQEGLTGAANSFVQFINTGFSNAANFSIGRFDQLGKSSANATDLLNVFTQQGVDSAIKQLKLLGDVSDEQAKAFLKQFSVLTDLLPEPPAPPPAPDPDTTTEDQLDRTIEKTETLEGSLADLQKQLSDAQKVLREGIVITDEQALIDQQTKINELKKQVEDLQEFLKNVGAEPIAVTDFDIFEPNLNLLDPAISQDEVEAELQKGLDKLELEGLRARVGQVRIEGTLALDALQDEQNEALRTFRGTAEQRDALNQQFNERRAQRERETAREIINLQLQILRAERQIAEAAGESVADFDQQIADLQLKLSELEAEEIVVKVEADVEDADAKIAKVRETIGFVTDGIEQLGGQIITFFQQQTDAALNKLEGDIQRQEAFLDALLGNTEDANAQQVQAERDRLDNLVKEREKAVERQQALAQIEVALNAAIAIAKAAAQGGAGAAITIAATLISLAIGFAQARAQAQQAFAGGTDFVTRAKGEPSGTDTVNAKLDEGEAVIQKDMNKKYHPAVKAIRRGKIDAKLLNDFVTNPAKYKEMALVSMGGLTSSSLQRQMAANNIVLGMGGGGMGKDDVKALISEMRKTRESIDGLPISQWNIKGSEIVEMVSSVQAAKMRHKKRFR